MSDPFTELPYPTDAQLQHGRIVLPRREKDEAISTHPDQLVAWVKAWVALREGGPEESRKVNLVEFWPELMGYLAKVRDGGSIDDFLRTLVRRLGLAALKDIDKAVIDGQYVGHCAIIDRPDPTQPAWVIESSHTHGGVRSVPYAAWEAERRELKAHVWLYDIDTRTVAAERLPQWRERLVDTAHRYRMQGVRYAIFDGEPATPAASEKLAIAPERAAELGDRRYLYCSELVWVCAHEVLGLDLRGHIPPAESPFRMFTPKDLTQSPYLLRVNAPGGKPYSGKLDLQWGLPSELLTRPGSAAGNGW